MNARPLAALGALLLAACATPDTGRIAGAATSPLHDLNLLHASIPPVLVEAVKAPYAIPATANCPAFGLAVRELDAALAPDVDAPKAPDRGVVDQGSTLAGDAAIGAIKGAADGLLPYRSWVRKLSGAERESARVRAAIAAGNARRSFLKGMMGASGCPWRNEALQPDP